MLEPFSAEGWQLMDIVPDGVCAYASLLFNLQALGLVEPHLTAADVALAVTSYVASTFFDPPATTTHS